MKEERFGRRKTEDHKVMVRQRAEESSLFVKGGSYIAKTKGRLAWGTEGEGERKRLQVIKRTTPETALCTAPVPPKLAVERRVFPN